MSNNDEMSEMGSLERETRREQLLEREQQRLERQARLAELNVPIEERMPRFEEQEPVANIGVNPFQAGQDVQFELPENHPLRARAAARNRVPSAAAAAGSVASQATVAAFGRTNRRTIERQTEESLV